MYHLDIDGLATAVAIANRASFSAAAKELGKTQAAVSFIVARLEQRLDTRLFERSSRGATLTVAGESLVRYARKILALESQAIAAVTGHGVKGRVRLGLPDDYLDQVGGAAIEHFAMACPAVQVDIVCDFSRRLESMIAAGDLDLAVVTRDRGHASGERLRAEPQVWCAAAAARPERLDPLPLALFSEQCRARPGILDALDRAKRRWRVVASCSHLHGVLSVVERGHGVTVLPGSCIPSHIRRLGPECGLPPLPPLDIALILPAEARVAARHLARTLRHCLAEPLAPGVEEPAA